MLCSVDICGKEAICAMADEDSNLIYFVCQEHKEESNITFPNKGVNNGNSSN